MTHGHETLPHLRGKVFRYIQELPLLRGGRGAAERCTDRRTAPGRGGKRTAARGRQPNLLSPILIVLIVIMAALLVYLLFGDRIAQRLSGGEETQDTSTEDVTPQPPDPDTADPEGGDGVTMPESGGTGEMEDPNDGGTTTPAQTDPLHPAGDTDHRLPGFPPDGVHHVRGR